jgi:hypothetical protein
VPINTAAAVDEVSLREAEAAAALPGEVLPLPDTNTNVDRGLDLTAPVSLAAATDGETDLRAGRPPARGHSRPEWLRR